MLNLRFLLGFVLLVPAIFLSAQSGKTYREQIDSLRHLPIEEWPQMKRAKAYDRLAELYFYESDSDSSGYFNGEVLRIGRQLQSDTLLGLAYRGKSMLMMQRGEVNEGIPYADTAVQYFQRANYPRYVYLTQRNLGYQYARQGNCVAAQTSMRSADSLMKRLELSLFEKARFRNTYAATLEKCRHYDLIPGLIKDMLPEVRQMAHPTILASYYNRLITAYRGMKQLDSALVYVELMGEMLPMMSTPSMIASYYTNAGNVYYDRGDEQRARELFRLGLAHAQEHGSPYSVNVKRINLGIIEQQAGNNALAVSLLETGKAYFEESNELEALIEIYPSLALAYASLERYRPAYENAIRAKELGDSLSKVYYDNSLAEKAALNETERTRYELEVVRLEKAEQEARNQARMRLLLLMLGGLLLIGVGVWLYYRAYRRRKDLEYRQQQAELRYNLLRAQMNPHFIFNSLNAIQNFFSGKRFIHGNEYLGTFSQLVRRILEQTGQASISLQEELDTLRLYLDLEQLRMGDKLTYKINLEPGLETDIIDVPPLVLQPFVENAIWHGIGPKNGPGCIEIDVAYLEAEDALHCRIQDDGVGMRRQEGKENEAHRSQGVDITRRRLGRGGRIDIRDRSASEPGHTGVSTELIIPLWD
ncbi:MAG: histidine kinase [Bacteroidota bacterium]